MRWIAIGTIVLLTGCAGQQQQQETAGSTVPEQSPSTAPADRYTISGLVLENVSAMGPKHGPQLCAGARTSLPPQCSGLDIVNWSWDGLEHEARAGAKWGDYSLTVRYDGTSLTLVEKAKPQVQARQDPDAPQAPDPAFATPCAPPAGGWRPVDPSKATEEAFQQAMQLAAASRDHAGTWIDHNVAKISEANANNPSVFILNVAYTGDLAAHETELRKVWGGSLCLSQVKRSLAELRRITHDLRSTPGILSSAEDVPTNTVKLTVWLATPQLQKELDQKHGPGVVKVVGALKPVGP